MNRPALGAERLAQAGASDAEMETFQKWAVEYALTQQKASKFQLDALEEMNFYDLQKKIRDPWDEALLDFRKWLDENVKDSDERDRMWREGLEQRDQQLLRLFRANLDRGRHCEAWIYHALLWYELPNQAVATREAYDVYTQAYNTTKAELEAFAKAAVSMPLDCQELGPGTGGRLHLVVVEGVGPRDPQNVADLLAGPDDPGVWPYFPSLKAVFNLSNNSEAPWNNFILADIRHYDRTTGDRLREGLDWFTGRWGVYDKIIAEKGMQAAQDAFRRNLSIESDAQSIEFRDSATHNGISFQRVRPFGTVYMMKRWSFKNRCTPATRVEADGAAKSTRQAESLPLTDKLIRISPGGK